MFVVGLTYIHTHTHTHSLTGMVENVALPYSDATSSESPSLEEMSEIVCERQRRPPIPDQWNRDEVIIDIYTNIGGTLFEK